MQAIYTLLLALFLSMALIPPLKRLAVPLGLTDEPDPRKIHTHSIPRSGGIAIVAGTLASILVFVPLTHEISAFAAAAAVLFLFGLVDDKVNLDYRIKLLGQTIAALIVILLGNLSIQEVPLLGIEALPLSVSLPLTLFFVVGITNAINLSDGLDGLAGGISVLALGCLAVFAYLNGDHAYLSIAVAMLGATFGFLRYNSNPAQIFMGDSGSQFLGFGTAVLALMVTQRPDSALCPLTPLLILGIPILDTLTVMARRIASGRSPFSPDKRHLHHQLLQAGLSQTQAVSAVYAGQLAMVTLAYLLRYSSDTAVLSVYILSSLALLAAVEVLSRRRLRGGAHSAEVRGAERPTARAALEARAALILRTTYQGLGVLLPAMLIGGALIATDVSLDIAYLSLALCVVGVSKTLLPASVANTTDRVTTYAAGLIIVFLGAHPLQSALGTPAVVGLFALLAVLTGIWARAAQTTFRTSTLDLLILVFAVALPFLSESLAKELAFLVLQSIIVFYAIEVLLTENDLRWDGVRIAALISLAIVSLKGFNAQ